MYSRGASRDSRSSMNIVHMNIMLFNMKGKWDVVSNPYNSLIMLDCYLCSLRSLLSVLNDFPRNLYNSFSCLMFVFSAGLKINHDSYEFILNSAPSQTCRIASLVGY
jgi:hypothetical protein